MKNTLWVCGVLIFLAGSVFAGTAHDAAADAAYDDGWQNYDSGGYGFGAWVAGYWATNGMARIGIGSSTNNGGSSSIDSSGESFYLDNVDGTNEFIAVYRYLDQDQQPGQTFSFDMDVNWRNGYKGFRARDTGEVTFFQIEVGNDETKVTGAVSGNADIGADYSDDTQYHVTLEQTSTTGGTWSVTRSGGLSDFDTGIYTGKVNSIELYSIFTSSNVESRVYYNNFDISYTPGFDHYGSWTNQYNLSGADADMDADPDGDNMVNLLEFSLGRDPNTDEGTFRAPEYHGNSSNGLVYVYTRYNDQVASDLNIDYSLVLTDDLTSPSWETNGFIELPPVYLWGDFVTVTNFIPTTNAASFATLQIESL